MSPKAVEYRYQSVETMGPVVFLPRQLSIVINLLKNCLRCLSIVISLLKQLLKMSVS